MLDFQALRQQLKEFTSYQLQFQEDTAFSLRWAEALYRELEGSGEPWKVTANEDTRDKLMAIPLDDQPTAHYEGPSRPTPMIVVATDGSQIYPDRHKEPLWYLINVSRIAFHYGTLQPPCLESVPTLFFRGQEIEGLDTEQFEITGQDVVSALRDEKELSTLFDLAMEYNQKDVPLLAIADGTLIRWMLRGIKNPKQEKALLSRYVDILDRFWKEQIAVCSYISMPGNKEFIRLLAHQVIDDPKEREDRIKDLNDRLVFERILPRGARSPLFKSQSKILSGYSADLQVCYFYVHVEASETVHEIARVEVPMWMTKDSDRINRVHATVLSEARKGRGYPMILSEAHEHAVVRGSERSLFYEMIEKLSVEQGRPLSTSLKLRAKERTIL